MLKGCEKTLGSVYLSLLLDIIGIWEDMQHGS